MFMGVQSHRDAPRVASYVQAEAALERASFAPSGRRRTEQPNGYHLGANRNHGVTWGKRHADGEIAFRLYDTDVVTWNPDNSVYVDNFGTVTTSGFADRFLPAGIGLRYPVERRGECGGDNTISYATDDSRRLCHGRLVRFVQHGERWLPDEDTCAPIRLPVLDRSKTRELAKRYHLAEFEGYLRMAPRMIDIEHDEYDLDHCALALEARDWRRAVETLPLIKPGSGFGLEKQVAACALPVRTYAGTYITMGSLAKLKLALWADADILDVANYRTVDQRAFANGMARVRELEALGYSCSSWGLC